MLSLATPPLRGPDETAHFLRAYGVAQGDLIRRSEMGRAAKASSYRHASMVASIFSIPGADQGKAYRFYLWPVFSAYFSRSAGPAALDVSPTFVPYGGSEGYSPVAYLPQAAAALVARMRPRRTAAPSINGCAVVAGRCQKRKRSGSSSLAAWPKGKLAARASGLHDWRSQLHISTSERHPTPPEEGTLAALF